MRHRARLNRAPDGRLKVEDPWKTSSKDLQSSILDPIQLEKGRFSLNRLRQSIHPAGSVRTCHYVPSSSNRSGHLADSRVRFNYVQSHYGRSPIKKPVQQ